jgi:putative PIG3 family NAD(P)H quinone oxidoreductase
MKYVAFSQPGGPEVLHVAEGPAPTPARGELLIEVEASGVSRPDTAQRSGSYPPPPGASLILGLEVAGTVAALGPEVNGFAVGDRVCALCNGGGYAEFVAVPSGQVLPLPGTWSYVEGATLPENAFTVFDNVVTRARLREGETLLVHGGTSGIGSTAIMFARALGARAIATAGSKAKCDACVGFGAELAIDYREEDFVEAVRVHTNGRGVDVVLDFIGDGYIERDLMCLALDGRIACIAALEGPVAQIDLRRLLQRRATLLGSLMRPRTNEEKAAVASALRQRIWPLLDARNSIVPVLDSVFTFSDAAKAHERMESGKHIGKIVLVPDA